MILKDNKGVGMVFGWIDCLIGITITIFLWIIFDYITWQEIQPTMVGLGLDPNSSTMVILQSSWDITPILFLAGWVLRIFVLALIKEPYQGQ